MMAERKPLFFSKSGMKYQIEPSDISPLTLSEPQWTPDLACPKCLACRQQFTFLNRKHHCRRCGGCFCGHCCKKKEELPRMNFVEPVLHCFKCAPISRAEFKFFKKEIPKLIKGEFLNIKKTKGAKEPLKTKCFLSFSHKEIHFFPLDHFEDKFCLEILKVTDFNFLDEKEEVLCISFFNSNELFETILLYPPDHPLFPSIKPLASTFPDVFTYDFKQNNEEEKKKPKEKEKKKEKIKGKEDLVILEEEDEKKFREKETNKIEKINELKNGNKNENKMKEEENEVEMNDFSSKKPMNIEIFDINSNDNTSNNNDNINDNNTNNNSNNKDNTNKNQKNNNDGNNNINSIKIDNNNHNNDIEKYKNNTNPHSINNNISDDFKDNKITLNNDANKDNNENSNILKNNQTSNQQNINQNTICKNQTETYIEANLYSRGAEMGFLQSLFKALKYSKEFKAF